MPEVRFEADVDTMTVLDGYCSATSKCRTEVINVLLKHWTRQKLHEATVIMMVAGGNPTKPEDDRKR